MFHHLTAFKISKVPFVFTIFWFILTAVFPSGVKPNYQMLSTVFTAAFVKHNNKIVSDEPILGYTKKSWYLQVTLKKKKASLNTKKWILITLI